MFTHVIWDWNGTLLDDAAACVAAINVLLERRKLPTVTHRQYLDVFDFPVRDYYLKLGFDFTRDDWNAVAEEYHAVYAATSMQAPLRDGTIALLSALQSRGLALSVLSACEISLLRRMMAERHILDFFGRVYGLSNLYAHSKVERGHALLSEAGIATEGTLMVGDTTHDFEVAGALGITCLLMTGGHQSAAKLAACGCPVVHRLDEVLEFVLK